MNAVETFRVSGARRQPVLLVAVWLHLLLQPALAGSMSPDMGNCHHAGDCPAMTGADCAIDQPLAVMADAQLPAWRATPALVLWPADLDAHPVGATRGAVLRPPTTGPPLVIRFGHLRN